MDKEKLLGNTPHFNLYNQIIDLHKELDAGFKDQFNRSLPLNEEIIDRWSRAKDLGFGANTSIYDSSFVFGKVQVGTNCWIGPYTIIDGSGGLNIGNYCTISVGVHIYTHDNIKQTLSSGKIPIERKEVSIGNNVYIGPNTIIVKGVKIGDFCVIGANSLINSDIPSNSVVFGQPGRIKGKVVISDNGIDIEMNK